MIAPGYIAHYDLNHTMLVFVLFSQQVFRLTALFVRDASLSAPYLSSGAEYPIFIENLSTARISCEPPLVAIASIIR